MIKFQNVTKTYKGSTVALNNCSVEIDKGEFVFLVGPSGSGKTTFIRLLLREELPDTGRIWEAGKEIGHIAKWRIPYLRRNIGCVFQDFSLLPNKTVFENVAFALEVIGRPKHVIAAQVPQVLDLVGLAKKRDNLPHELSGGEQQRVAVARAFVNRPLILLADEPTGNLDPTTSLGIMRLLDRINRTGTTVIIATHDAGMVDQMRRRVIELDRGLLVRDQAHGVYGIDSATVAAGAGSPTGSMADTRRPADCPTASPLAPDAGLSRLRLSRGGHQPVAQSTDDGGRHSHRRRVAGPGRLLPPVEAGGVQGHRAVAKRGPGHCLGEPECQPLAGIGYRNRAEPVSLHQVVHPTITGLRLQRGEEDPAGRRERGHHSGGLPVVVPLCAQRPFASHRRLPEFRGQAGDQDRQLPRSADQDHAERDPHPPVGLLVGGGGAAALGVGSHPQHHPDGHLRPTTARSR